MHDEFETSALEEHNRLRSLHGAPPLILDYELSRMAQYWSKTQARSNKMMHGDSNWNGMIFGENLACCSFGFYGHNDAEIGRSGL